MNCESSPRSLNCGPVSLSGQLQRALLRVTRFNFEQRIKLECGRNTLLFAEQRIYQRSYQRIFLKLAASNG